MHDRLAVERLPVERQHDRIGDDVVDIVRGHGGEIAEIADLDRRRAARQNAGAGILGVADEVDGDVDVEIAQRLRGIVIGAAPTHR